LFKRLDPERHHHPAAAGSVPTLLSMATTPAGAPTKAMEGVGTELLGLPQAAHSPKTTLGKTVAQSLTGERFDQRRIAKIARSCCRFVQGYYGLARGRCCAPLTPRLQQLYDLLPDKYSKIEIKRLLVFAALNGIEPTAIQDAVMAEFRVALERDPTIRNADVAHKRALRAWNRAASRIKGWPQQRVTVPRNRKIWGKPWSHFPPALRSEAHAFLARKLR
jgi:hypothetical protein